VRIGICSYWFNRGQAVVGRQLRSALDGLGHETSVLARPTRATNIRPAFVDRTGVWDQPGITEASDYEIPAAELLGWAREHELEAVLFDQNYGFEAIGQLRRSGVRTIGRFVWEQFSPEHVEPARDALDVVYSLTEAERARYAELGIESPRVRWGIHPELLDHGNGAREPRDTVSLFFPGGFMSRRKPFEATLEAFSRVPDPRLRLVFKSQVDRRMKRVAKLVGRDRRVEIVSGDLPTDEHLRLFASADVCLAPSRWEGLGLHLYEATAFGMPVVTNDNPPMNEVVEHERNGLLVAGVPAGTAKSGIPAYEPDVGELAGAIARIADDSLRSGLAEGAREARERMSWERTVADLAALLEGGG
jgi:glycosyltransferase involved in cell wall biosynthesis